MFGSGSTTLIISNEEMIDIKSLEESNYYLKVLVKKLTMKQNNKKEDFLLWC